MCKIEKQQKNKKFNRFARTHTLAITSDSCISYRFIFCFHTTTTAIAVSAAIGELTFHVTLKFMLKQCSFSWCSALVTERR